MTMSRITGGCLILLVYVTTSCGIDSEVQLIHSYPESENFNYVELTCKGANDSVGICTKQTTFYLNQTDIQRVLNVTSCINGTIAFVFSQSDEGNFTCSQDGTMSNVVALAAEPEIQFNETYREHEVLFQPSDDQVATILQCDIQPGLLRQRYNASWNQLFPNTNYTISDVTFNTDFNLRLNVTRAMNFFSYQCKVTINHTELLSETYLGAVITLHIRTVGGIHSGIIALICLSIIIVVVAIVAFVVIGICCCRNDLKRHITKFKWFWQTDTFFQANVSQTDVMYYNINARENSPSPSQTFEVSNTHSPCECSHDSSDDSVWSTVYANKDTITTCDEQSLHSREKEHNHSCDCTCDLSASHLQSSSCISVDSNHALPCSIPGEEGATGNTPLHECGIPPPQESQWKFEDETDSPTENNFASTGEYSASQFSTDSCSNQERTGCYGYLPDQCHSYSPSQISTYGVRSQVGILDTNMYEQNLSSQKLTGIPQRKNPYRRKEKRKGKKKPVTLDKRTDDSGIGQSLSPVKTLSPHRQYVSLTQGPPFPCDHMSMMNKGHFSMDFKVDSSSRKTDLHRSITNPTAMNKMPCRGAENTTKLMLPSVHCEDTHSYTLPKRKKRSTQKQSITECSFEHRLAQIIPKCIRPTATLNCTSAGLCFDDEANDFTLVISEGAIPDGEKLIIDIGVALYGPFHYPEGFRPISPVFWLCVRGHRSYKFRKPVKITIQHFLSIESDDDITLTGLSFAKAGHDVNPQGKCSFSTIGEIQCFEANSRYGSLFSNHFCYLCIVGKINEPTLQRTNFCLFGTIPSTFIYDKPMYVFFFVTYFLKTCLETVRKQIMSIPQLSYCKYTEAKTEFHFLAGEPSPAIGIQLPQNLPGGWQLGLQFKKKITVSDIDFMAQDTDDLQFKESEGEYPPHFRVVIDGTHTIEKATAHLTFSGTADDLVFDIHLIPPTLNKGVRSFSQVSLHLQPEPHVSTGLPPLILPDLLNLVVTSIPSKWRTFGIMLELPNLDFDTYPIHNDKECFVRVLCEWKKAGQPEYSWETVLNILEMPYLNEQRLAMEVRSKLILKHFSNSPSFYPPLSCPSTSKDTVT